MPKDFERLYNKWMNLHFAAVEKGNWTAAERHAKCAVNNAEKHFKTTGKKVFDPGYTGSCPFVTHEAKLKHLI